MRWHTYVAHFLRGMFLVNAIPHSVSGLLGRAFPSPFASPPGQGESTALTAAAVASCPAAVVDCVPSATITATDIRKSRRIRASVDVTHPTVLPTHEPRISGISQ